MASVASEWVTERQRDAAFESLFAAEYATVVAVAWRVLADQHQAEDIAQDVFCQFYRLYSPAVPWAGAWLRRAAVHGALNAVRGDRRREQRERQDAQGRDRLVSREALTVDPQVALEQAERTREVRTALAQLPRKHAAVLALRYSGLSYAEVAAALGVKVGQVGTMLRRAEAALRKELTRETST